MCSSSIIHAFDFLILHASILGCIIIHITCVLWCGVSVSHYLCTVEWSVRFTLLVYCVVECPFHVTCVLCRGVSVSRYLCTV